MSLWWRRGTFYNNDAAQRAADNLNTQLQQLNQNHQIGFATVNNNAYVIIVRCRFSI